MIFDPNSAWIGDDMDQETYNSLPKGGTIFMKNSKFTEEEIEEFVEKLDNDFGLFVTFFMNKHGYNGVDIKTYDPSTGTENKFEVRRVQWFDEEKEEQNDIQRNGD